MISNVECLFTKMVLVSLVMASYRVASAANTSEITKPGCQEECGGVQIPYPFAIRDGNCHPLHNTFYTVVCDNSSGTPVPRLAVNNQTILSISTEDSTIRFSSSEIAYQCYNNGLAISSSNHSIVDVSPSFNISTTKNILVGIGCDTIATYYDTLYPSNGGTVGCITSCSWYQPPQSGSCSGVHGCCTTSIFSTILTIHSVRVQSMSNHTGLQVPVLEGGDNNCSVAFVTEAVNGSYDFSVQNLTVSPAVYDRMRVPVVYDWFIPSTHKNCSESMKFLNGNDTYVCGSNTQCLDLDSFFYRCQCSEGYTGNPYLPNGCQDINECADSSLNDCEKQEYCVNKAGGYDCKCQNGHGGNATKASPCFPIPNASRALILGLSISLGSILVFIFIGGLYKLWQRTKETKEREGNFERNGGKLLAQQLSTSDFGIGGTKIYSKVELEKATDNFNDNRVLGRGGQGIVYKGMLSDGRIVAIKKCRKDDERPDQSTNQFINEVVVMSKINHRHVVKVLGVCLETKVPLLVYEYVPNGTLEQHIHNPTEEFHITWKMRFQIALDSAGALAYLHSSSDIPTYHRDIKSSNILLDEKYKAKVSDFGISKNISMEQTHVTTAVQGTYGYLDPEYYQLGQFTDKSDVYSFGVVLLELLTSKRPISINKAYESQSLVAVFLQLSATGSDELYHILDTEVLQECPKGDIETLVTLTKRCLSMHGRERPTMKEVAMTLEMIKAHEDQVLNASVAKSMEKPDENAWSTDQIQITMGDEGPFTNSSMSASLL